MFAENTFEYVDKAFEEEYKNACAKYGSKYNSTHEAFSVLKEELEEVATEFNSLKNIETSFWNYIRGNNDFIISDLSKAVTNCRFLIMESLQVLAVLKKIADTMEGDNK